MLSFRAANGDKAELLELNSELLLLASAVECLLSVSVQHNSMKQNIEHEIQAAHVTITKVRRNNHSSSEIKRLLNATQNNVIQDTFQKDGH